MVGGPITFNLRTERMEAIRTPTIDMLKMIPTYGYYQIKRIQMEFDVEDTFYDVWLLTSNKDDVDELEYLSKKPSFESKCCMFLNQANIGI